MIFISTSSVRYEKIRDSVKCLVENGFFNIELSGGTRYYSGYEKDLIDLKEEFNLNFICHNYFPPPKKDFIINLASLDGDLNHKTIKHINKSINLSKKLGAEIYGFHAGFYLDFGLTEIGENIAKKDLYDEVDCFDKFCVSYDSIDNQGVDLYIENNVVSHNNYLNFGHNPFMLTDISGYDELSQRISFKLLLDVAHLKIYFHLASYLFC